MPGKTCGVSKSISSQTRWRKKIEAANCRFTGGKNLTGYTSVVEQNVVFIYGENPVMRWNNIVFCSCFPEIQMKIGIKCCNSNGVHVKCFYLLHFSKAPRTRSLSTL